jgi:hypothetical protein
MTSIKWLVKQLNDKVDFIPLNKWDMIRDLVQQAKEMHKDEIENAHIEGQRVFDDYPHTQWTNDQAELYYEKTYNERP